MAQGKNTTLIEVRAGQIFPNVQGMVDSTVTFYQGDYLVLDSATHLVRPATAEGEANQGLGIANLDVVAGKIVSPYSTAVDAAQANPALNGPTYGNVQSMVLKTGTTIATGAVVYLDIATGNRGVAASGTKIIGVYQGANLTSSVAGQEVACLIGARYPGDTLKF